MSTYVSLLSHLRRVSGILFAIFFFVIVAATGLVLALAAGILHYGYSINGAQGLFFLGLFLFSVSLIAGFLFNSERLWLRVGEVPQVLRDLRRTQAEHPTDLS